MKSRVILSASTFILWMCWLMDCVYSLEQDMDDLSCCNIGESAAGRSTTSHNHYGHLVTLESQQSQAVKRSREELNQGAGEMVADVYSRQQELDAIVESCSGQEIADPQVNICSCCHAQIFKWADLILFRIQNYCPIWCCQEMTIVGAYHFADKFWDWVWLWRAAFSAWHWQLTKCSILCFAKTIFVSVFHCSTSIWLCRGCHSRVIIKQLAQIIAIVNL